MAAIHYKRLVEDVRRLDEESGKQLVRETFKTDSAARMSFSIGRLFEEIYGRRAYEKCRARDRLVNQVVQEDGDSTQSAAFVNITGQIFYSATLERYQAPEFVFTKLIPEMPSQLLQEEKIAGVTRIGNQAAQRNEGEAFKLASVGENWIHAPMTIDRGFMTAVTYEAVFTDRTGQLVTEIGDNAYWMGHDVEERAIDAVIDLNAGATSALAGGHRYHWRNTSIATYGDNSGTHTWDNLQASNALVDWTDVEGAELLLAQMVDPFTGKPILLPPEDLIVCPQLLHTAKQVIHATENRLQVGGYATSGNLVTRVSPNTMQSYRIVSSPLLYNRQVTVGSGLGTTWYLGSIGRALKRKVNWPLETIQAPPNTQAEFERRIVMQFRTAERSGFFYQEPRFMVKSTA